MAEEAVTKPCSNPGCDQPGTKSCSACHSSAYCGPTCQTADWPKHKEECDGHLRKVGKANLDKAMGFYRDQNWLQALRYNEIADTKLKQLKDRRLETVQAIDAALIYKFNSLGRLNRHREALVCIKECYTLWAMNHLRNPGSMNAALLLIQSCIHNKEYEDAERYARHAYFMIVEMNDNFIPSKLQPLFLADVSYWLAAAIKGLSEHGGVPPAEKQTAGEEAIGFARKALEMRTQLHGTESDGVACAMGTLANILDHFNDVDDDEVLRLFDQSIAIFRRVEGSSSMNVAATESNLGTVYLTRAKRVHDQNRFMANLELALSHYREAARIFRAINHVDNANEQNRQIANVEEIMRRIRISRAATAAAAAVGSVTEG